MQETAIVWFVVAWLACWLIDLVVIIARGPLMVDPLLKLVVIVIALAVITRGLARHNWLW